MKCKRLPQIAAIIAAFACAGAALAVKPDPFLDEVQHRSFNFFWHESNPTTGITKDRAHNFTADTYDVGSIASTGFALSALPIGVEHGWVSRSAAKQRALITLRFMRDKVTSIHGIYPHFLMLATGERAWNCEYSTIDTTLLISGAITAGEYFGGEVKTLAEELYGAADWKYWSPRGFVCMGMRPQEGALMKNDWGGYCEDVLLYVLALGSPSHPSDAAYWDKLGRWVARYGPFSTIAGSALFVNQYQNLWVDLHGWGDGHADYWEVARINTLANRQFCIDQAGKYPGYGPDVWGLTAGDGPNGYDAYAAEPGGANHDGTINPHAAGGSFMFTPVESRRALRAMLDKYRAHIWGRYGFSDGFNVGKDWWAPDVIGIDTGATLLSIENQRTGLINRLFMKNPAARTALKRMGMKKFVRPSHAEPVRAAAAMKLAEGMPQAAEFSLGKLPAGWKGRKIVLYGGVIEERTVSVTLNGKSLGTAMIPHGIARAACFNVPAKLLNWGKPNRISLTLANSSTAVYGPILIGPIESIDYLPLKVSPAPAG